MEVKLRKGSLSFRYVAYIAFVENSEKIRDCFKKVFCKIKEEVFETF